MISANVAVVLPVVVWCVLLNGVDAESTPPSLSDCPLDGLARATCSSPLCRWRSRGDGEEPPLTGDEWKVLFTAPQCTASPTQFCVVLSNTAVASSPEAMQGEQEDVEDDEDDEERGGGTDDSSVVVHCVREASESEADLGPQRRVCSVVRWSTEQGPLPQTLSAIGRRGHSPAVATFETVPASLDNEQQDGRRTATMPFLYRGATIGSVVATSTAATIRGEEEVVTTMELHVLCHTPTKEACRRVAGLYELQHPTPTTAPQSSAFLAALALFSPFRIWAYALGVLGVLRTAANVLERRAALAAAKQATG